MNEAGPNLEKKLVVIKILLSQTYSGEMEESSSQTYPKTPEKRATL